MITIFAPEHFDQRPVRIWNRQLIGYAGHRQSDGSIVGDPLNVPLTEVVRKLGWTRDPGRPLRSITSTYRNIRRPVMV